MISQSPVPNPQSPSKDRRAIVLWLALCALLVASMVLIGGYTRLSGSGLSITEWKPIHGAVPPLNAHEWQEEFDAYKRSPQYIKVNHGMTLAEFKVIFWPEFLHRLLGRAIGTVFFIPLIIFAARRSLSKRFGWRLAGIFALGGLQGLIGWLMVRSGLVNDPHVSVYRLALHLSMALLIYALLLWAIAGLVTPAKAGAQTLKELGTGFRRYDGETSYTLWFAALCIQIVLGACMAGLHAGLVYNTWPDMNGHFLPQGWDAIATVQFLHRNMAVLVAFGFIFWWYSHRGYVRNKHLGKVCAGAAAIIAIQFALGVATLLHQAPLPLALAHQMTALLLFTVGVIILWHVTRGHRIF